MIQNLGVKYTMTHVCEIGSVLVTTLALGSQPKQRGCKSVGQEEARESHHILSGV